MKKEVISKKYNKEFETYVYSGTLAIETVLINENISKNDLVLVPNNVCYRVLSAILKSGAIPLIVEPSNQLVLSTEDFKNILDKYKVKVIMAVHQFGLKVDVEALKKLCHNNEIIIEDIAQGWDVKSNNILGVDSDYIVTSMGSEKPLDFGIGGIILTNKNLYHNMDYNNIKSRYSDDSKLIPYTLPANINFDIEELMHKADLKKKNNIEYAKTCINHLNNRKISFYEAENIEDCYWERFPIWTEDKTLYDKLIEITEKNQIQYEPSHSSLLQDLPLLNQKDYKYVSLSDKKRLIVFLKTRYFEREKLIKYIEEINQI